MLVLPNINKMKLLNLKKSKLERINSDIFPKNNKNGIRLINYHSYIMPKISNINNNSLEDSNKVHNNVSNSVIIPEKEKNILNLDFIKPIKPVKLNNSSEKAKTERQLIFHKFEHNKRTKNKFTILSHRENNKINEKKISNQPIEINKFINEINSFLLPNNKTFENLRNMINYRVVNKISSKNAVFNQLFRKNDLPINKFTYKIFYKYIIKNTFKEVLKKCFLNNTLIDKKAIKEEYRRQINKVKLYFTQHKIEDKDIIHDKDLESFLINNNSSMLNNLSENKIYLKNNYNKMNSHKRNKNNIQNNSLDNAYSKFYDFNKGSIDFKIPNNNYNNKAYSKKKSLSLPDSNGKFHEEKNKYKSEILKAKEAFYKNQNVFNIIQKQKSIINKNKKNKILNNNDKENFSLQLDDDDQETLKAFSLFSNRKKENNNKNEDIIGFLNNNDKKIKFSNRILNEKINKLYFKGDKLKLHLFKEDEINLINTNNLERRNLFNKSLIDFKKEDDKIHSQPMDNISFLRKSSSQRSFFVDKNILKDNEDDNNIQPNKNKIKENTIKKEKEKYIKILFKKKLSLKKKNTVKERTFKDYIKEESYEEKVKTLNNKIANKKDIENRDCPKILKIKKIKIEDETDKEMDEDCWEYKFNNFKNYIQRLKNMTNDEFLKDTFKFIKFPE